MELGAVAAVLAALGGVLKLVLDHLGRADARHEAALEQIQARQEKFLGNHMSGNTKALADLTEVISELVDAVHERNDEDAK